MTIPRLPKCAIPGCQKHVSKSGRKYCSARCGQLASKVVPIEPCSPDEAIRRENIALRNELKKATSALKELEHRTVVEDRLVLEIQEFVAKNPYRPVFTRPTTSSKKPSGHEMVVCLSDAHLGEVVSPEATMGLTYNSLICQKRLEHCRDAVLRYVELRRSAYPISKLTVAVLGDMISGDIHEELSSTNDLTTSEAVVKMAYMLYEFGLACAKEIEQVEFVVVLGNHARTTQKPRYKQKALLNWEFLMGKFVQALANNTFNVIVPESFVYIHDVFNKRIAMSHGDGIQANGFANIPWYSMRQRQSALQSLLRHLGLPAVDMLVMGHFHQMLALDLTDSTIVINGSIIGGGEYSVGSRYASNEPVQTLLTFHPTHGLTDISRITFKHIL